mgnify:CR=1 FL=1
MNPLVLYITIIKYITVTKYEIRLTQTFNGIVVEIQIRYSDDMMNIEKHLPLCFQQNPKTKQISNQGRFAVFKHKLTGYLWTIAFINTC